jgi:hypothetical protein
MLAVKHHFAAAVFALATAVTTAASAQQSMYAERVRNMCTSDAMRLCSEHALGSSEMRYCMEANFRKLSKDCIVALEDEGLVPRSARKSQASR